MQSWWKETFGVTDPDSTNNQIDFIKEKFYDFKDLLFLYLNVSALHQPNHFYLRSDKKDCIESHAAALKYVDSHIKELFCCIHGLNKRNGESKLGHENTNYDILL